MKAFKKLNGVPLDNLGIGGGEDGLAVAIRFLFLLGGLLLFALGIVLLFFVCRLFFCRIGRHGGLYLQPAEEEAEGGAEENTENAADAQRECQLNVCFDLLRKIIGGDLDVGGLHTVKIGFFIKEDQNRLQSCTDGAPKHSGGGGICGTDLDVDACNVKMEF